VRIRWAHLYDRIYAALGKDYAAESDRVLELAEADGPLPGSTLLDVACGTGGHLVHLRHRFDVVGIDVDEGMLAIARRRLPDIELVHADMREFDLGRTFSCVTCLFGGIGYLPDERALRAAIGCMARHVSPGGVLIVEPWIFPETFRSGFIHVVLVDEDDLKAARITRSTRDGATHRLHFHFAVATPDHSESFDEEHALTIFERSQYEAALEDAGLRITFDDEGVNGRGLFIGWR
jgi:ubiquinone/menaquinone biosynthesis C-methylase UbiE